MQSNLHNLLQKEVSRKEFLITLGYGAASVLGLGSLLRLTGHKGFMARSGYGSSPYGR